MSNAGIGDAILGTASVVPKGRLMTASRVGASNRGRVLETLHRIGPASRARLARELGVNRATIASILQPLIDSGTLVEGAPVSMPVTGGKPARPLWFSTDGPLLGGVHITPEHVRAALIGFDGTIRRSTDGAFESGADAGAIMDAIVGTADDCFDGADLVGIGVAIPGMVNTRTGSVISVHLAPGLDGMELKAALAPRYRTEVLVDHHPRVQALGDRWFGKGKHVPDFASVYTGEALGFGIVAQGVILRGRDGAGGESGHTIVQMDGELCRCGRRGCWETVATLGWLRREGAALGVGGADGLTSARLSALCATSDPVAEGLLDRYARNIAIGMANNEQVLASGTYIMHGDVCGGGECMQEKLQQWMTALSPQRGAPPSVLFADQPDVITLLGGAGLVLSSVFASGR
jgi:predicted NBD/HSP70 family sugar kinase